MATHPPLLGVAGMRKYQEVSHERKSKERMLASVNVQALLILELSDLFERIENSNRN